MNEENKSNQQNNNDVKIEFVPAKTRTGATSASSGNKAQSSQSSSVPRRKYTSAKRDFSQLPHRQQNGGQRPPLESTETPPQNQAQSRQSRKISGANIGMIVLFSVLILAIIAGVIIIAVFVTGNKHFTETFRDDDKEYSISYMGKVDDNENINSGTLKFSDNSSADIKANGDGTYTVSYSDGSVYVGKFEHMHRNGTGVYTLKNGDKYTGNFHYDNMWGKGCYEYANGDKYEGDFVANKKEGKGTYTFKNGDVYVGSFSNDMRNGKGVYTYADGSVYEGNYVNNTRNDENASMTIMHSDGTQDKYIGSFVNDSREGKGTYIWANGDSYEGNFTANNMNGEGTYKWASGRTYTGQFKMGSIVKDPSVYPEL